MLLLVRRWWPERQIVVVADSTYASLKLLDRCRSFREASHLHHPLAPGRCSLRASAATQSGTDGTSPTQGRAAAESLGGGRRFEHRLEIHHSSRLVRQSRAYAGDDLRNGGVVQHGIARCAHTLGTGARSTRGVRHPSLAVHRSWRQTRADPLVVCLALADGDDLSGSASASGCGDPKAVVGAGDTEDHTDALKLVLARHLVRSPENGAEHGDRPASGVVPQTDRKSVV